MKYKRPSKQEEALSLMKDKPLIKRLIIEVDESFHYKVKEFALKKNVTIKELIYECLNKCINV